MLTTSIIIKTRLYRILPMVVMVSMAALFAPQNCIAETPSERWNAFIAGGLSTLAIHELGHFSVAAYHGANAELDGVTVVYPDANFNSSEALRTSSAGLQFQWIASEIAFGILSSDKQLSPGSRSFTRGIVAGHIAITLAYLTILKDHPDGDLVGMSDVSGLSTNELALLVAVPAALDGWRLMSRDVPDWVPKLSLAYKGIWIAKIWNF